tara:strand:+ start:517 stop:1011 length:495 start_codon:yes stop_codon:yes gene_type:complete
MYLLLYSELMESAGVSIHDPERRQNQYRSRRKLSRYSQSRQGGQLSHENYCRARDVLLTRSLCCCEFSETNFSYSEYFFSRCAKNWPKIADATKAIFAMPVIAWDGDGMPSVKPAFKYYWAITMPLTLSVFLAWGLVMLLPWHRWNLRLKGKKAGARDIEHPSR